MCTCTDASIKLTGNSISSLSVGQEEVEYAFDHVAGPHTSQEQFFRGKHVLLCAEACIHTNNQMFKQSDVKHLKQNIVIHYLVL